MALRTDANGFFTIQNIPEGLYGLTVDGRSLPLGYGLAHDKDFKATIADGHVSNLDIAITQKGQIRGFTFVDKDGDKEYDKGETRVEGIRLLLEGSEDNIAKRASSAVSTSFGQFAFDDLIPGDYEIEVDTPRAVGGIKYKSGDITSIKLEGGDFAMQKIAIPIYIEESESLLVKSDENDSEVSDLSKQAEAVPENTGIGLGMLGDGVLPNPKIRESAPSNSSKGQTANRERKIARNGNLKATGSALP